MKRPDARDPFYSICGVVTVLLVAAAVGVPALWGSSGHNVSARATPAQVQQPIRTQAETVLSPVTQRLQPATISGFGV